MLHIAAVLAIILCVVFGVEAYETQESKTITVKTWMVWLVAAIMWSTAFLQ